MEAIAKITLDLLHPRNRVIVHAKQFDSETRTIQATLLCDGLVYEIPSGAVATFSARKPSDTAVWKDATINGSMVSYTLTQNDLAVAGYMMADFQIWQGEDRLSTFSFLIDVEPAAVTDEEIEDSGDFSALQQLVSDFSQAVDNIRDIDYTILNPDYTLTIYYTDGTSYTTTSIRGEKGETGSQGVAGPRGATGVGLDIKGLYVSQAALEAAVPSPSAGDTYMVGASAPYDLYIYSGSAWENNGAVPGLPIDATLTANGQAADAAATGKGITDVQNAVNPMLGTVLDALLWQLGTINGTTGQPTGSGTRARTANFIPIKAKKIKITAVSGYKFSLRFYATDVYTSFTGGDSTWITGTKIYDVTPGTYFRIVAANSSDTNISTTEALLAISESYSWPIEPAENTLNNLRVKAGNKLNYWLVQGTASIISGNYSDDSARCRIGERDAKPYVDGRVYVYCTPTYKYRILIYTDGTYSFGIDWQTGTHSFTVSDNQTFRVVVSRVDEANVTPSEISDDDFLIYGFLKNGNSATSISALNGFDKTQEKLVQMHGPYRINNTPTYAANPFTLLHFSDLHADITNLQRIVQFYKEFGGYITDIIHTGDSVEGSFSSSFASWFGGVTGAENILNTIGNHDTRVGSDWQAKTAAESYANYFAPFISNWGATYTENLCYYYKDYANPGIRLIVLDAYHMDATQLSWFTTTLEGARTNGYVVIVAAHVKAAETIIPLQTTFDDSWYYGDGSGPASPAYPSWLGAGYSQAVNAFIQAGGKFAAWLCGHHHCSRFGTVQAYPNQLCIGVTTAAARTVSTAVAARDLNTKSQDAFNVLSIDPYLGILKMIPIGNDYDLRMRHRESICWDYVNGQILYTR